MPKSHLLTALAFSRMRTQPTMLDTIIQDEVQEGVDETVEAVMAAQADLQAALDWLRLELRRMERAPMYPQPSPSGGRADALSGVEEKAAASLAKLYDLLKSLGKETAVPIPNPKVGMLVYDIDFPQDRWEITAVSAADDRIDAKRIKPNNGFTTSWTWDVWDNAWFQGYLKEATE